MTIPSPSSPLRRYVIIEWLPASKYFIFMKILFQFKNVL